MLKKWKVEPALHPDRMRFEKAHHKLTRLELLLEGEVVRLFTQKDHEDEDLWLKAYKRVLNPLEAKFVVEECVK